MVSKPQDVKANNSRIYGLRSSLRKESLKLNGHAIEYARARYVDTAWYVGPIDYPDEDDPDGSEYLLSILDGRPLIICRLNGEITLQSLTSDIEEIDYPRLISVT